LRRFKCTRFELAVSKIGLDILNIAFPAMLSVSQI
jgi:hypothetical protein